MASEEVIVRRRKQDSQELYIVEARRRRSKTTPGHSHKVMRNHTGDGLRVAEEPRQMWTKILTGKHEELPQWI